MSPEPFWMFWMHCPKQAFASYLDLFFFLVSILSSCTPEPVFILNVWPQKYITDFVAKQIGVACHLPLMGQTEMLKVEIGKTVYSIKVFWQFSMGILTFYVKLTFVFLDLKYIYNYYTPAHWLFIIMMYVCPYVWKS